jgi:hypothetical protein
VKGTKGAISILALALVSAFTLTFNPHVTAQKNKNKSPIVAPTLTRTTSHHENRRLAYGGTVTIIGAPVGSITIEGWPRNEVDVAAEIELHAGSDADLAILSAVNGFFVDEVGNHVRILTTGTHDREFMKRVAKNFPKNLNGLPWKIDFRIKVPVSTDLEISQGSGPIKLAGVEGALRVNALESEAMFWLTGGIASITIQRGSVYFNVPGRGWHGLGADVKLAGGNLTVELPADFSADIDAAVMRLGGIDLAYDLEPRDRNSITSRSVRARAGSGGATLSFTVGDGTIRIKQVSGEQ